MGVKKGVVKKGKKGKKRVVKKVIN